MLYSLISLFIQWRLWNCLHALKWRRVLRRTRFLHILFWRCSPASVSKIQHCQQKFSQCCPGTNSRQRSPGARESEGKRRKNGEGKGRWKKCIQVWEHLSLSGLEKIIACNADLIHGVDGPEGSSVAVVEPQLHIQVRGVVGDVGQKRCSKSQRAHDHKNRKQNLGTD